MNIKHNTKYRIKGNSNYFKEKYGTSNPIYRAELPDTEAWEGGWGQQVGNPACMLFGMRAGFEKLDTHEVWYGQIKMPGSDIGLGELVCADELEEILNKV